MAIVTSTERATAGPSGASTAWARARASARSAPSWACRRSASTPSCSRPATSPAVTSTSARRSCTSSCAGEIEFRLGDDARTLGPGGLARVDPQTVRGYRNASDTEEAVYVCVGGAGGYVGRDGLLPEGETRR